LVIVISDMIDRAYWLQVMAICLGVWLGGPARADIYTFKDANGILHFTNVPADPRYSVMIRESKIIRERLMVPAAVRSDRRDRYGALVEKAAREHNLDQALLQAVITAESDYNPRAVSHKGAVGLMQLMPETARRYGVTDLYDPVENIHAGARYLRDLMQKFNNDLSLTLAAYNAGESAIVRYGNRIPPYSETRQYVPKVMDLYRRYQPENR
jgi:soluble lytic murein transglycosylase-like protein